MVVDAHVGTVLADRYELVRHIARGGMGDVYEGIDQVLDRRVAVKVFRATMPADRERFDAEVRVLASLNHPGLVPVFDAGSIGEDAFVVLELIEGPPLRTRMEAGPLPSEDVREIALGLAEALAYIHGRGVVHRDVTPSNILCQDGRCRLVDFGIARLLDAPRLTSPQLAIGTAAYMAPEQVRGEDVTGAADVYSLGLVLLEALTGQRAFPGPSAESSLARLVRDPDTTTGVPAGWQDVLAAMTARDPMDRPTAAQVATRLVTLPTTGEVALATVTRLQAVRSRRQGPGWAVGIAAALVAAVILVVTSGGGGGHPGDPADAATTTPSSTTPVAGASRSAGRHGTTSTTTVAATAGDASGAGPDAATGPSESDSPTTTSPRSVSLPTAPPRASTTTTPAPTTTQAPATTAAPPTTSAPPTTTAPAA
jgi:serine/threonine protein kinase